MTDLDELEARLRDRKAFGLNGHTWIMLNYHDPDCHAAAQAIATLRDENEVLNEANSELLSAAQNETDIANKAAAALLSAEAELARIEEETIERCCKIAWEYKCYLPMPFAVRHGMAAAMRSLPRQALTEESEK